MSTEVAKPRRPLIPLLLLHTVAAGFCFGFFTLLPIGFCLLCMAIGNDMGGPMLFPILEPVMDFS